MKKLLIYLFIFLIAGSVTPIKAQEKPVSEETIELRIPSEEKINEYKNNKHFQYGNTERIKYPDWLLKFFDWVDNILGKTLSTVFTREFLIILFVFLLAALTVALILRSQGMSLHDIFGKRGVENKEGEFLVEDVTNMDFQQLIDNSIKSGNYRLAVRFLYLKNLKALSDQQIINWKLNKTNYSYQYEINNPSLRAKFLESTRIFDFVWYGEFLLDERNFKEAYNHLDEFNKMIINEG